MKLYFDKISLIIKNLKKGGVDDESYIHFKTKYI